MQIGSLSKISDNAKFNVNANININRNIFGNTNNTNFNDQHQPQQYENRIKNIDAINKKI
jgi:hypothetical protein